VLAQSADVILTSTLRRASDSATVLGVDVHEKNELFNEADIPKVNIPYLKLKPKSWLVILRLMLLLGLGKKDVSLKASKSQAKEAAQKLLTLSTEHDNVVLVGHGGMNWLIGKQLRKEGWALEGKLSHQNWGSSVFKIE
jgi:broad specificity phosphatase PhoE